MFGEVEDPEPAVGYFIDDEGYESPTPDTIKEMCRSIQKGWTHEETMSREFGTREERIERSKYLAISKRRGRCPTLRHI